MKWFHHGVAVVAMALSSIVRAGGYADTTLYLQDITSTVHHTDNEVSYKLIGEFRIPTFSVGTEIANAAATAY